tara:strand:+ start:3545 stop:4351 length:807 start_codon:yes stop_codon:yes gene_type:complete
VANVKCCERSAECIDGEWACSTCGLVLETEMETKLFDDDLLVRHKDKTLGSFIGDRRGVSNLRKTERYSTVRTSGEFHCNMVASEFNMTTNARDTMKEYYYSLKNKAVFNAKISLEVRAAAIGYVVLREYAYAYTLREVAVRLEIPRKVLSRHARSFARVLNKGYIFTQNNVYPLIEKFALRLGKSRQFMNDCLSLYEHLNGIEMYQPTSVHLAAVFYAIERCEPFPSFTQKVIGELFSVQPLAIRTNVKKIKSILNVKEMSIKDAIV